MTNLEELRALLEKVALPLRADNNITAIRDANGSMFATTPGLNAAAVEALIVAAVNALPALLAEVETLRGAHGRIVGEATTLREAVQRHEAEAETLRKERDAAREALRQRGTHSANCRAYRQLGRLGSRTGLLWNEATDATLCDCGLAAALTPPKPEATEAAKWAETKPVCFLCGMPIVCAGECCRGRDTHRTCAENQPAKGDAT